MSERLMPRLQELMDVRLDLPKVRQKEESSEIKMTNSVVCPNTVRCVKACCWIEGAEDVERYCGSYFKPQWPLRALCFEAEEDTKWAQLRFPPSLTALALEGHHTCPSELLLPLVESLPNLRELHAYTAMSDETFLSLVTCNLHTIGIYGGISKDCIQFAGALGLKYLRMYAKGIENVELFLEPNAQARRPYSGVNADSRSSGDQNLNNSNRDKDVIMDKVRLRLLGEDANLCYWWQMGVHYDAFSWYGLNK